jgi:hypothetical protein
MVQMVQVMQWGELSISVMMCRAINPLIPLIALMATGLSKGTPDVQSTLAVYKE